MILHLPYRALPCLALPYVIFSEPQKSCLECPRLNFDDLVSSEDQVLSLVYCYLPIYQFFLSSPSVYHLNRNNMALPSRVLAHILLSLNLNHRIRTSMLISELRTCHVIRTSTALSRVNANYLISSELKYGISS